MNKVLETIASRFSCRDFTDRKPDEEVVRAVAAAAMTAPSAVNACPWQVIVVTNEKVLAALETAAMKTLESMPDKTMYNRIMERGGRVFYGATGIVLVPTDPAKPDYAGVDSGIVCQNIALACESLGLGSVICGMIKLAFAGENGEELREICGVDKGYQINISVLFGEVASGKAPHDPDLSKLKFIL